MMLIWQEFKAIVSDVWDKIMEALRKLSAELQAMRADMAANYQLYTVMVIGLPISLAMLGLPMIGLLGVVSQWLSSIFDPRNKSEPQVRGEDALGLLLIFVLGFAVAGLTAELATRVEKRLEGKSKSDDIAGDA